MLKSRERYQNIRQRLPTNKTKARSMKKYVNVFANWRFDAKVESFKLLWFQQESFHLLCRNASTGVYIPQSFSKNTKLKLTRNMSSKQICVLCTSERIMMFFNRYEFFNFFNRYEPQIYFAEVFKKKLRFRPSK